MSVEMAGAFVPATPFIKFHDGSPYIEGQRCGKCGAVYTSVRIACSRCTERGGFTAFRAAQTGRLYSFSIVGRSYPGVSVPFISAVVDLDDAITLKGNLLGVDPDPARINFGMPVRVVFSAAPGQTSKDGRPFMAYFFEPAVAAAEAP
jgi:uncharacterized OB-fold protein